MSLVLVTKRPVAVYISREHLCLIYGYKTTRAVAPCARSLLAVLCILSTVNGTRHEVGRADRHQPDSKGGIEPCGFIYYDL